MAENFYMKKLKSDNCICGRSKQSKKSFCHDCWKALPEHMQKALYYRIGHGYEDAYDEAVSELQQLGKI